ncbi:MAG: cytochrome c biogenesis protein CcsA [Anaerolineales bacterium]
MSPQPRALIALNVISLILLGVAYYVSLVYAPLEAVMGQVQRLFYFHVATAWVGMIGFVLAAVAGVLYLWKKDLKWDSVSLAAVEISLVFFFIAIVLGSIWARPIWGTWWTWEPRLTTAAILQMIYMAYLLLRQGIEDPEKRARFGAVYTLLGGISVPLTFISIRIFRTIHPVVIGTGSAEAQGGFNMTPLMLQSMFFSIFAFSVIFVTIFWHRMRMASLESRVEQLKLKVLQ